MYEVAKSKDATNPDGSWKASAAIKVGQYLADHIIFMRCLEHAYAREEVQIQASAPRMAVAEPEKGLTGIGESKKSRVLFERADRNRVYGQY